MYLCVRDFQPRNHASFLDNIKQKNDVHTLFAPCFLYSHLLVYTNMHYTGVYLEDFLTWGICQKRTAWS